ncbi:cell wall / vacuolar inhibitor of fructosidase 2-like [Punica granatum]|uniref:Pectinesterase inhibitor domain-containing protein n=2 Tax=Punica granatum TaxID=22663 RepID=A0A218XLB2_PUNGR|nr:cell wall / vacuolar inhibitor of fructosidase 2-like [Punica granatum]OWM85674.1 hypothetical protein CDL15_Pgr029097 [Punica granatum]PKI71449.1 hypothetical protein CRG98_008122 [Punica granatum]
MVALQSFRPHSFLFSILIIVFFFSFTISISSAATETVQKVCNQTSYYRYCVATLYSDPRTPNADPYFLAYISFGLAYLNASNSHDFFSHAVNNTRPHHHKLVQSLTICQDGYKRVVSALETAYEDLNTESFAKLGRLSRVAGRAADKCNRAFSGVVKAPVGSAAPAVAVRNRDMKRLSEICSVVSKLLGASK